MLAPINVLENRGIDGLVRDQYNSHNGAHETFYVDTQDFKVTTHQTHWLGLGYDSEAVEASETTGNGVLQSVSWKDGEPLQEEYSRSQFQALKDVVGDRVDDGELTLEEARSYMVKKLQTWSCEETAVIVPCDSVEL
jgi:hypothetical protein